MLWAKKIGGIYREVIKSVATDSIGNVYVGGYFDSPSLTIGTTTINNSGGDDVFFVKYDELGNIIWSRGTGGSGYDEIYSVATDNLGNLYLTGTFSSPSIVFGSVTLARSGGSDMFLVKYNTNGSVIWGKREGASNCVVVGNGVTTDKLGNVFVTGSYRNGSIVFGTTTLTNHGSDDFFLVKYNPSGNVIWAKSPTGGAQLTDIGMSVITDDQNNVYVAGYFNSPTLVFTSTYIYNSGSNAGINNMFLYKFSDVGNLKWRTSAGTGTNGTGAYSLAATDSNIYVSGWFINTVSFGNLTLTGSAGFLVKYISHDISGEVSYAVSVPGSALSVSSDFINNAFVTGSFSATAVFGNTTLTSEGNVDIYIAKYGSLCLNPISTPTITSNGSTTFCQGNSVTLTSSPANYYLWSNGATTQSITTSSAGNYSVTISDGIDCSVTSDATTVIVNPLPTPTITPGGNTTFCSGGSVTLTSGTSNSYLWSPGGATTQSISVSSSGSYTVTTTNGFGCSGTSSAINVTVNPLPTPSVNANGATTFCQGGSVTLTSSSGNTYLWSNNATTQSITVSTSGSYYVWTTDANGCAGNSASSPIVVTVNSLPTATITPSGPTTFCSGGSVTLTSSSGSSYLWSPSGATTQSINVTSSDSYVVTITNSYGCSATSQPTIVTVNSAPTTTITPSGNTTFCEGNSVTLTSTTGISYLWSPGGETSQSINTNNSGSYAVTVTFSPGCSATSTPVDITVNPNPSVPTVTPNGNTTFCQGGSVQLTSSIASFYSWSPGGANSQTITANTTGIYIVTVSDLNNCSASSTPLQVTVNPLPQPTITPSGNTTFCQGGSVTLTSSSSSGNVWSPNGETAQLISAISSGNYTVTVTNGNGCIGISPITTITVNQNPSVPVINLNGATLECSISASSYQWYNGGNIINGETNQSFTPLNNGDYTVTITDNNGCQSTSLPYSVNTVNVEDANADLWFVVYPNPATTNLTVESTILNNTPIRIDIKNSIGQIVYLSEEKVNTGLYKKHIDTNLVDGVYYLSLQTDERRTTRKIEIYK